MDERHWTGLLTGTWRALPFEPFRPGIEIHWLVPWGGEGSALALLRYEPGGRAPRHTHPGLETILVLEGTQHDEQGVYPAGSLVLNRPGSEHSVWSPDGCVVLISWDKPVRFLEQSHEDP